MPLPELTFLFSDIEGSTRLWEIDPDAMASSLRRHEVLISDCVSSRGGRVFKSVGDQLCSVFSNPDEALGAAIDVQQRMSETQWETASPLLVRIGVHCGPCEERDDDYFGPTLNRVARIEAAAHGGQVLCSESVAIAVGNSALSLRPLGTFALGGLRDPERLFQVELGVDFTEFPPLRIPSVAAFVDNLPAELSSFIGREIDVAELEREVRTVRLVTLVGVGGIGKTRLALKVARRLVGSFGEGVWHVDLVDIEDDALVADEAIARLDLPRQPGASAEQALLQALRDQHRLVLFDNCESVVAGAARLIGRILAMCPRVSILATSRESLDVEGEYVRPVAPLGVPDEWADTTSQLEQSPAVALFVARAAAQDPSFVLTDDDSAALARLSRSLDGIPLAIELAAAWVPVMSLDQLGERVVDQLALSTRGRRDRDNRQRTMRAVIEWSVDQLSESDRVSFFTLGVFEGPFSFEAAAAVMDLDDFGSLEVLSILVQRSLLLSSSSGSEARYSMIGAIRAYALDSAQHAGVASDARRRHASHYRDLARHFAGSQSTEAGPRWRLSATSQKINLLAAGEFLVSSGDASDVGEATGMLGDLTNLVDFSSNFSRSISLVERCLSVDAPRAAQPSRAGVLVMAAALFNHIDFDRFVALLEEAIDVARATGERPVEARAMTMLAMWRKDVDLSRRAVEIAREVGEPAVLAGALDGLGSCLIIVGDPDAESPLLEALSHAVRLGDTIFEIQVRLHLSGHYLGAYRFDDARAQLDRLIEISSAMDPFDRRILTALLNLGSLQLHEGAAGPATRWLIEGLSRARTAGLTALFRNFVLLLAACSAPLGELEISARLHGAAAALDVASLRPYEAPFVRVRDDSIKLVREALGSRFEKAFAEGTSLGASEVVALARRVAALA